MPSNQVKCPTCGQDDLVFHVRLIYMECLEKLKDSEGAKTPEVDRFLEASGNSGKPKGEVTKVLRDLVHQFEPPQGKPQLLKTISPDMVVVVFSALAVFLLYQIYLTQPEIFWYMGGFYALFIVGYIVFHKTILARYEKQKAMDTGSVEVIQKAIGKWMKASYCLRDDLIFGVRKNESVPLAEMTNHLIQSSLPGKE